MSQPLPPELEDLLATAGSPAMGLRERKRIAAMRRLQRIAIEQFEEHGFDKVTVEHIAEHAEVSPSSVYRYFGTKEGLVIHDEYDDLVLALLATLLADHDPWSAFARAMEMVGGSHFAADADLSMRRSRIWYETPAVRAAGFLVLDTTAKQLAPMMHAHDRYGRTLRDYEIVSAALLAALFACLEHWYLDGGETDLAASVIHAVELVKPAWAND